MIQVGNQCDNLLKAFTFVFIFISFYTFTGGQSSLSHIAGYPKTCPPEVFIIIRPPKRVQISPENHPLSFASTASISINSPDWKFLLSSTDTEFCSINPVSSSFVEKKRNESNIMKCYSIKSSSARIKLFWPIIWLPCQVVAPQKLSIRIKPTKAALMHLC